MNVIEDDPISTIRNYEIQDLDVDVQLHYIVYYYNGGDGSVYYAHVAGPGDAPNTVNLETVRSIYPEVANLPDIPNLDINLIYYMPAQTFFTRFPELNPVQNLVHPPQNPGVHAIGFGGRKRKKRKSYRRKSYSQKGKKSRRRSRHNRHR